MPVPRALILLPLAALALAPGQGRAQKPAPAPAASPAASDCLRATDPLTGTLRQLRTRHPNGTPIEVIQLWLDRPACMVVPGLDGSPHPLRIQAVHLVSQDAALRARLRGALGRRATVQGGDVMEPHTAWHIGDLVMFEPRMLQPPSP